MTAAGGETSHTALAPADSADLCAIVAASAIFHFLKSAQTIRSLAAKNTWWALENMLVGAMHKICA